MPRPKREEVHRHFEALLDSDAAGDAPDDDAASAAAAGEQENTAGPLQEQDGQGQKVFKHARVRCRHCGWRSKRDASRQAKHLSQCGAYREWCSLNGETVVSLTAAPKRGLGQEQNEDGLHGGSGGGVRKRASESRVSYSPLSRQVLRATDGLYYGGSPVDMGAGPSRTPRSGGQPAAGSAEACFISTPAPVNPRTGVFHGQNGVPLGPGPSSLMGGAGALGHRYGHDQGFAGEDASGGTRGSLQMQGLGEAERRRLNILYARALVAIGTKDNDFYDRTRHPQMCAFLKALNPGYEPPPKEELGALVVREFFGGMGGGGSTTGGGNDRGRGGSGGEIGGEAADGEGRVGAF